MFIRRCKIGMMIAVIGMIGVSIKGFGGNQFKKHCFSTVRLFIKVLAGFSLITTVIVL